jgi:DNA replication protein DnaC
MTHPPLRGLRHHRGALQLVTAQERLEALLPDARAQEVTSADFLDRLHTAEITAQGAQAVARRTGMARAPSRKTLERFDDGCQPAGARQPLQALATGRFLEHGEHSVFRGPPGTGNTHWAMGLGLKAVQQGPRTLFPSALLRIATLTKAYAEHRFEDRLQLSTGPTLLLIDARGSRPLDRHGAYLCFQLNSRREARSSAPRTTAVARGPRSSGTPSWPPRCWTGGCTPAT